MGYKIVYDSGLTEIYHQGGSETFLVERHDEYGKLPLYPKRKLTVKERFEEVRKRNDKIWDIPK